MNIKRTNKIVVSALFAAVICVINLIVHIPLPSGYGFISIGDSFVLAAAFILGPVYGTAAAAIGSGLSDLILGYAVYIPATVVIKACVALLAYLIFSLLTKHKIISIVSGCIVGELPMAFLYLFYEYVILRYGASSVTNLPFNLIQGAISAVVAIFLIITINKTNLKEKYL